MRMLRLPELGAGLRSRLPGVGRLRRPRGVERDHRRRNRRCRAVRSGSSIWTRARQRGQQTTPGGDRQQRPSQLDRGAARPRRGNRRTGHQQPRPDLPVPSTATRSRNRSSAGFESAGRAGPLHRRRTDRCGPRACPRGRHGGPSTTHCTSTCSCSDIAVPQRDPRAAATRHPQRWVRVLPDLTGEVTGSRHGEDDGPRWERRGLGSGHK